MELEDSIVCPDHEGKVLIPIRNATNDSLRVLPGELIGSVGSFELEKDAVSDDMPPNLGISVAVVNSQPDEERRKKLATTLRKAKGLDSEVEQQILDCALDFQMFLRSKIRSEARRMVLNT